MPSRKSPEENKNESFIMMSNNSIVHYILKHFSKVQRNMFTYKYLLHEDYSDTLLHIDES